MNDQFLERIFVVNRKQILPLVGIRCAKPRFDRDAAVARRKNLIEKRVERIRPRKQPGAAPLGDNRAGRTAKVQIDGIVAVLLQFFCQRKKVLRLVCENLREHRHPFVMLRENVIALAGAHLFICNKWREITVSRRKIFVVGAPVHISGQPFHRGEIKLHDDKILSKKSVFQYEKCIIKLPEGTEKNESKIISTKQVRG